ncbi:J domain-containing protein [Caulobacter mirabilis]|uniref:Molecular chaperone DnaJ n=1 Tax=Caulobacter mirabilis TaxID=69666 RepID=A0A2D2AUX3_9CAUL|nr:J domain-containing protein [Caulobacter mirabilis]ATQ41798.1 molecular chaperone DnaJ [Caulobacter mirabilis]
MAGAFQYRPKFVDIRVRPPKPEEEAAAEDVTRLKPGERRCDHADCMSVATARAPKSRDLPGQFYWFCQQHAAEYNKSWNFFAGMTDEAIAAAQAARATGERPTWSFKASNRSRESAARNKGPEGWNDPFSLFGFATTGQSGAAAAPIRADGRTLGKLERNALADLDLPETAEKAEIRVRYTELVKKCHPDTNGGDSGAVHKLQRVLKAWKTLKKSGLA